MYFDATGKYVTGGDILNNVSTKSYDIMKKPNRMCKGNCVQYKASKPVTGGRYEAGQYRCQTCEIYMTERGVDGHSCKCCNMRVRSKPRNSFYKEKYNDKVRNAKDPWISLDETLDETIKENTVNNSEDEKKSTPIYEEIDESVKTYYEFKDFLKTIKLQANYQLVMLKELLEYGELHKGEISESLAYFNNKNTTDLDSVKYYFNVPVYDVLLKHEFVIEDEGFLDLPYYSLNVQLEGLQKTELIDYLTNEIQKYNQEHNIPENEFPNSDNMRNFLWTNSMVKNKSNVEKIKNFVKKITPNSTNSLWIWSVTPNNWEIVKSKNVWGSRVTKEKISQVVKSGDQVAFYVISSNSFKGIYEFVGDWHDSPGVTWDDDLEPTGELRYKSQIEMKPICLGLALLSELHEKMELFQDKPTHIRNLVLQGGNGYPSNNQKSLTVKDFEIILDELKNNSSTNTDVSKVQENTDENIQLAKKETISRKYKICPRCNETQIPLWDARPICRNCVGKVPKVDAPESNLSTTPESKSNTTDNLTVKECPKCHETRVEGLPGIEFDNKIEELFGYRQFDSNDPETKKPQSYCRACRKAERESKSEEKNMSEDESSEKEIIIEDKIKPEQFIMIDSKEGDLEIKHYELQSTDIIQKEQTINNDGLMEKFGVGNMGGIRYSRKNNVLVLCSTHSNHYDDEIDEDANLIKYTGEGQIGEQTLTGGNYKIANSQNMPILFFKERYQEPGARKRGALDNIYTFVGKVMYVKHYWKEESDKNGNQRQVLKFLLEIQS